MANPRSKEVIAASDQRLIEVSAGSPSLEGTALISDASEMRRSQLPLDWLKSSGLLILTITGLILYIVFSVPATIFYDRLGTTPQEVGITYTSILSGSTLGALAVIGALLLILIYIIVMAFYATLITWMSQAFPAAFQNRSLLFKGDWELDANQFDDGLKLMKSMYLFAYGFDEQDWRRVEAAKRRVRSLRRLGVLTAEQTDELESLKSQI